MAWLRSQRIGLRINRGSGDPVDAGIVLHVHCGYHQVMRAEPVAFELVRTADRIVLSDPGRVALLPLGLSATQTTPRLTSSHR